MIHGPIKITVLLLVEMMMVMVVNRSPGDYAFNGTIIIVLFVFRCLFFVGELLVSRQANCECLFWDTHHGILSLLLLLSSLFSLFLWIDLLHNAIPKGSKRPLLALVVDHAVACDFVELIDSFSTMEENWRAFGGRCWSEYVQEEDAVIMR